MGIIFDGLEFSYSGELRPVLSGLDGEFRKDEITVLTGTSGCGKSTLLYLAAGLYPGSTGAVMKGRVTVDGNAPGHLPPQKRCILAGMMFQNPDLQFCMDTVRNELIFCLENIQTDPGEIDKKIREALDFCGIAELENRTLITLSGGEKQKVALACLAAINPGWLLLDEPFANIDEESSRSIAERLGRMHSERGTGILAVDHRLDSWLGIADTIRVMEDGKLLPESLDARSLDPEKLESLGIIVPGGSYSPDIPPAKPGDTVLELSGIEIMQGGRTLLLDVNASFRRGVIYAVLGQSGTGKSTLFSALSGVLPYRGEARLEGRDIRHLRRSDIGKMGFITQNPQDQFVEGTVRQEILTSLRKAPDAAERSEEILRRIKLWRYRDISPYMLSQGQQRRLGTAALIAYDCHCLVCDEPTYAQDRRNTIAIMDALCRQAREKNIALIFSTHDRQLAKDYADEILEIKEGTLHAVTESGL